MNTGISSLFVQSCEKIALDEGLDGGLFADGSSTGGGAGSGGGIYVVVTNLVGAGSMAVNGGNGIGGGGARIAVYAADYSGFNLASITAYGGTGLDHGGPGTVYLRDRDEPVGVLVIDAGTAGHYLTPLGFAGQTTFTLADAVIIRGANTHVTTEHAGLALDFQDSLTIENSGHLSVNGAIRLNGLLVMIRSSGLLEVNGTMTSLAPVTVSGGTLAVDCLHPPNC